MCKKKMAIQLPNNEQNAKVCDATNDDSSRNAR